MEDERAAWETLGKRLQARRLAKFGQRSGRKTADRLGIDEGYLRWLEQGGRTLKGGVWQLPTHTSERIVAYARLVDDDPAEVLALIGREYRPEMETTTAGEDSEVDARLSAVERGVAELRERFDQLEQAALDRVKEAE